MFAYEHDIHRTVHAGEATSAKEMLVAINHLKAERIGHGYRAFQLKEGDSS